MERKKPKKEQHLDVSGLDHFEFSSSEGEQNSQESEGDEATDTDISSSGVSNQE